MFWHEHVDGIMELELNYEINALIMNDFGMDMQSICKLNKGEMGMIVYIDICKKKMNHNCLCASYKQVCT